MNKHSGSIGGLGSSCSRQSATDATQDKLPPYRAIDIGIAVRITREALRQINTIMGEK